MCLARSEKIPEFKTNRGYKIYGSKDHKTEEYKSCFMYDYYALGQKYVDKETGTLCHFRESTTYPKGFHIYESKEDAITVMKEENRHFLSRVIRHLIEVEFGNVVAYGVDGSGLHKTAKVIVAREIKLLEEIKWREYKCA